MTNIITNNKYHAQALFTLLLAASAMIMSMIIDLTVTNIITNITM